MSDKVRTGLVRYVITCLFLAVGAGFFSGVSHAGVLEEDRADLLYFRYEGGGVTVNGPSMLVRKSIGDHVSVSANYMVDMVSSASIDVVVSGASPDRGGRYQDQRTQSSLTMDYLLGKSTYSVGYINSDESDYKAKTWYASVSHDMFGDLTTISFGFKKGENQVFKNFRDPSDGIKKNDPNFNDGLGVADMESKSYNLGVSQIVTRNLILSGEYEVITDEGWLNSPYRSVRYLITPSEQGFQPEKYPNTHSSNAASIKGKYFLPWRAALDGSYRFYTDTWGVIAHTAELGYVHPLKTPWAGGDWIFEGRVHYYTQTAADFYADLFPRADFSNFMARDKELSTYSGITTGLIATYEFKIQRFPWLTKGQLNFRYDYMAINYDDFRDARYSTGHVDPDLATAPGQEPLYELRANMLQFYISAFF